MRSLIGELMHEALYRFFQVFNLLSGKRRGNFDNELTPFVFGGLSLPYQAIFLEVRTRG
jgi:hypothetical protein